MRNCRRKCRRKPGQDFITNMPDNIMDTILASMPLCDAVRTSVLSREWRHKWKSIPALVFDSHFNKPPMCNHQLQSIICNVLDQHRGHINKFVLQVFSDDLTWQFFFLMFLIPFSGVHDFTLHLYHCSKEVLPRHVFRYQNLMHLNLYRCVFKPPPQFQGFTRLITLDFQDVEFVPAAFGHFISLCLLLERVRLVSCTEMDSFEVEAPCLRFFHFYGVFKKIDFKNSPVLAEVSLSIPISANRVARSRKGFEYFHFLPSLEKLHLHPRVLETLGAAGYSKLPECLNSLKALNLSMYLDSVNEVACALRLARNSPQLEMLQVSLYATSSVSVIGVMKFLRAQEKPDPNLKHIKKVRIGGFSCVGAQKEFLGFVLACAGGLEELGVAWTSSPHITYPTLKMLLALLPRASPTAKILILTPQ